MKNPSYHLQGKCRKSNLSRLEDLFVLPMGASAPPHPSLFASRSAFWAKKCLVTVKDLEKLIEKIS